MLRARVDRYAQSEQDSSARENEAQRLNRSVSALDLALKQANAREETLRRRLVAITAGRPELPGPPVPDALRRQPQMQAPALLSSVLDRKPRSPGTGRSEGAYQLLSPVGTYLREERPTFTWRAVQDAVSYDLIIYTPQSQEVARETGITEPARVLGRTLPRGKVYRWEIRAFVDGREIAHFSGPKDRPALFGILSNSQLAAFDQDAAKSRLSAAAMLAKWGLLDEAEAELETLASLPSAPLISRRAHELRNQIRDWRK